MKILLLSCSTGEGHNHCAKAVRNALEAMGHQTDFIDMLHLFGEPGPISIEALLNDISTKVPNLFGLMYKAGERVSELGVTSPVYLVNTTYGQRLSEFINERGYDAVICSHLFPMETLTYIRRHYEIRAKCYGILSDYTCIPFLAETELDLKPWNPVQPNHLLLDFCNDETLTALFDNLDANPPVELRIYQDEMDEVIVTDVDQMMAELEGFRHMRIGEPTDEMWCDAASAYTFTLADGREIYFSFNAPGIFEWHGKNYTIIND